MAYFFAAFFALMSAEKRRNICFASAFWLVSPLVLETETTKLLTSCVGRRSVRRCLALVVSCCLCLLQMPIAICYYDRE